MENTAYRKMLNLGIFRNSLLLYISLKNSKWLRSHKKLKILPLKIDWDKLQRKFFQTDCLKYCHLLFTSFTVIQISEIAAFLLKKEDFIEKKNLKLEVAEFQMSLFNLTKKRNIVHRKL